MKCKNKAQAQAIYYKYQNAKIEAAGNLIISLNLFGDYIHSKYKSVPSYLKYKLGYSWDEKDRKWKR